MTGRLRHVFLELQIVEPPISLLRRSVADVLDLLDPLGASDDPPVRGSATDDALNPGSLQSFTPAVPLSRRVDDWM